MTGPVTHWLVAARTHTESDMARHMIDRAIFLVRKIHYRKHLGS